MHSFTNIPKIVRTNLVLQKSKNLKNANILSSMACAQRLVYLQFLMTINSVGDGLEQRQNS